MTDQQIISERARLQAEADAIVNSASYSRKDEKRVDTILSKLAGLRTDAERGSRIAALADEVGLPQRSYTQREQSTAEMRAWFMHGGMTAARRIEQRGTALNVGTGTQGAFFVPADFDFSTIIRQQMKQYDGILIPMP